MYIAFPPGLCYDRAMNGALPRTILIWEEPDMNSLERFYKTIAYEPVDRPACWLGDPTPEEARKLCQYYGVETTSELKKVVGDDFYAVELP